MRLESGDDISVSELAAPLKMKLPAMLKHLDVLETARLITRKKSGRTMWVTVAPAPMAAASEWLSALRALLVAQPGSIGGLRGTEEGADMSGLKLVRQIAATPERVFDAISTAEGIAHWFGPDAGPVLISEMSSRVGGRFRVRFRMLDQSEHECTGKILELTRPTHLLMTWEWIGRDSDGDSRVEFTLRANFTRNGINLYPHTQLPSEQAARSHEHGWNGALDKLERRFRRSSPKPNQEKSMQKITPFLWYTHEAEEAAKVLRLGIPRLARQPRRHPAQRLAERPGGVGENCRLCVIWAIRSPR